MWENHRWRLALREPSRVQLAHLKHNLPTSQRRTLEKEVLRAVGGLDDQRFKEAPHQIAKGPINALRDLGVLVAANARGGEMPSPAVFANMVESLRSLPGFTLSPYADLNRRKFGDPPEKGYCVALPGFQMQAEDAADIDKEAYEAERKDFRRWINHVWHLLETGQVWIGGWNDGGKYEINLTLVLPPERRRLAKQFGKAWDQKSIWSLGHQKEINTHGDNPPSIYEDRERLRRTIALAFDGL